MASPSQHSNYAAAPAMNGHHPAYPSHPVPTNGDVRQQPLQVKDEKPPTRTANPMSFSSILSGNISDPLKDPQSVASPPRQTRKISGNLDGEPKATSSGIRQSASKPMAILAVSPRPVKKTKRPKALADSPYKFLHNMPKAAVPGFSDKENEKIQKELEKIDAMPFSPVEGPGWEAGKLEYHHIHEARQTAVDKDEKAKRRVSDIGVRELL